MGFFADKPAPFPLKRITARGPPIDGYGGTDWQVARSERFERPTLRFVV